MNIIKLAAYISLIVSFKKYFADHDTIPAIWYMLLFNTVMYINDKIRQRRRKVVSDAIDKVKAQDFY